MSNYEFICTKKTLKNTLRDYGVAVILDVLDEKECEKFVSEVWDYFEFLTQTWEVPISRDQKSSWVGFYKLYPLHSMLIQHWGVGHAQASWNLRQNPNIVKIFAKLWDCKKKDLLVSFDGLSLNLPPEVTNRGWYRNTWYHTDQSFTDNEFKSVQSFITGLDIHEYDATFSFLEGSHLLHKEFGTHFGISVKDNWYKLTKEEEEFFISKNCIQKNIKCPKGSLVLWDSRTIHCGIEANRKRKVPNLRVVAYLCYAPRNLSSEADLRKKKKAFEELRTTTHNPSKVKLFPKHPRTYGGAIPEVTRINSPVLSKLGMKLAGY